jgi:hypothetical protein
MIIFIFISKQTGSEFFFMLNNTRINKYLDKLENKIRHQIYKIKGYLKAKIVLKYELFIIVMGPI